MPGLHAWTVRLLERLVADGKLSEADIAGAARGNLWTGHHERVARALETYLNSSGDYTYTLELSRRDQAASDPGQEALRHDGGERCREADFLRRTLQILRGADRCGGQQPERVAVGTGRQAIQPRIAQALQPGIVAGSG